MEPKSPLSRIAATQSVPATTSNANRLREALAQLVLRHDFPLETIFEAFAQKANSPPDVAADPAMALLPPIALRLAETSEPSAFDVQASATQFAIQLQDGLYELWHSSWRPGMTAQQAAEIATSIVGAGATSMFEPRTKASSTGPLDPALRLIR